MAGIKAPDDHFEISEGIIGYVENFKGQDRVNIRKSYVNKEEELCVSKGLCITMEQWADFVAQFDDLREHIGGY